MYDNYSLSQLLNIIYNNNIKDTSISDLPLFTYAIPTFIPPHVVQYEEDGETKTRVKTYPFHPSGKPRVSPDNVDDFIEDILEENNLTQNDWNSLTEGEKEEYKQAKIESSKTDYANYVEENCVDYYKRILSGFGGDILVPLQTKTFKHRTTTKLNDVLYLSGYYDVNNVFLPINVVTNNNNHPFEFNVNNLYNYFSTQTNVSGEAVDTLWTLNPSKYPIGHFYNVNQIYGSSSKYDFLATNSVYLNENSILVNYTSGFLWPSKYKNLFGYSSWTNVNSGNNLLTSGFIIGRASFNQLIINLKKLVLTFPFSEYESMSTINSLTDVYLITNPNRVISIRSNANDPWGSSSTGIFTDLNNDRDRYTLICPSLEDGEYRKITFHILPNYWNAWQNNTCCLEWFPEWVKHWYGENADVSDYCDCDINKWEELFEEAPLLKRIFRAFIKTGVITDYNGELDSIIDNEQQSLPNEIFKKLDYVKDQFKLEDLSVIQLQSEENIYKYNDLRDYCKDLIESNKIPLKKDFDEDSTIKNLANDYVALILDEHPSTIDGKWDLYIPNDSSSIWDDTTETWRPFDTLCRFSLGNKTNINTVYIPSNITEIKHNILMKTSNILNIIVDDNNPRYTTKKPKLLSNGEVEEIDDIALVTNEETNVVWDRWKYLDEEKTKLNPFYKFAVAYTSADIPKGILGLQRYSIYGHDFFRNGEKTNEIFWPSSLTEIEIWNLPNSQFYDTAGLNIVFEKFEDLFLKRFFRYVYSNEKEAVVNKNGNAFSLIASFNNNSSYIAHLRQCYYYDNNNEKQCYFQNTYKNENGEDVVEISVPNNIVYLNGNSIPRGIGRIYLNNVSNFAGAVFAHNSTVNEFIFGDVNRIDFHTFGDGSTFMRSVLNKNAKSEYRDVKQFLNIFPDSGNLPYKIFGNIYFRDYHNDHTHTIANQSPIRELVILDSDFPNSSNKVINHIALHGCLYLNTVIFPKETNMLGIISIGNCGIEGNIKLDLQGNEIQYDDEVNNKIVLRGVLDFSQMSNGGPDSLLSKVANGSIALSFILNVQDDFDKQLKIKRVIIIPNANNETYGTTLEYTKKALKEWIGDESDLLNTKNFRWWAIFKNSSQWVYSNNKLSFYKYTSNDSNDDKYKYNNLFILFYGITFMTLQQYKDMVDPNYTSYDYSQQSS